MTTEIWKPAHISNISVYWYSMPNEKFHIFLNDELKYRYTLLKTYDDVDPLLGLI